MTSAHTVRSESRARSWWRRAHPVKRAASAGSVARPGFHFGRGFEGWPFAVVSVGLALIGLALGGLRPVEPEVIPPPFVDAEALRLGSERRRGHARLAVRHPLTFEVRAAGEQFRRYGLAVSQGTLGAADQARSRFEKLTAQVLHTEGSEPLLSLRAVQTELFLQALLRWEATRRVDQDLLELGGDFPAKARSSGWVGSRLQLTTDERAVLFLVRWTRLAQLMEVPEFAPTLNEWRVYYRFLLYHPQHDKCGSAVSTIDRQLEVINALERRDPAYPAAFARGVLFYRRGDRPAALRSFRSHLAQFPDGQWQLRVRNHLSACLRAEDP